LYCGNVMPAKGSIFKLRTSADLRCDLLRVAAGDLLASEFALVTVRARRVEQLVRESNASVIQILS